LHLKDISKIDGGWFFAQLGKGAVNYDNILRELADEKNFRISSVIIKKQIIHIWIHPGAIYSAIKYFLQRTMPHLMYHHKHFNVDI